MRLYRFIRYMLIIAVRLYFIEVRAIHKERVPEKGPVMLAANHPSSILDSVLLSTQLPRPVHYLAKSELFSSRILTKLYSWLGAIPVYRGSLAQQNSHTFRQVFELFKKGGYIGIFPEGRNSPDHQIANLRTGTAKMALEGEAENNFALGLVIVPVGIHFENRELFLSAAQLKFGDPIKVADYQALYQTDPKGAIRALTARLQDELRQQALHIEDQGIQELVTDLAIVHHHALHQKQQQAPVPSNLFKRLFNRVRRLFKPADTDPEMVSKLFNAKQQLNVSLSRAKVADPLFVQDLRLRVNKYKDHLKQLELKQSLDDQFDKPMIERLIRLRLTLYAVAMAPIAFWGLLHNVVPYSLTKALSAKFEDPAVKAFAYFFFGFFSFVSSYFLIWLGMWQLTDHNITSSLMYMAFLPPTGLICLRYRGYITQYRYKILLRSFFFTQQKLFERLHFQRNAIITRVEQLHERYGQVAE